MQRLTRGRPAGEGHKAAKKRLKVGQAAGVAKVVGTSKLRTKYESHEAKRNLCAAFDLFLADERILPSLPKLLGAAACLPAGGLFWRWRGCSVWASARATAVPGRSAHPAVAAKL